MDIKIQCDSCSHKSICKIKEALTIAKNTMEKNYQYLSDTDKALADSVIFMADCRHYTREPQIAKRADNFEDTSHYEPYL